MRWCLLLLWLLAAADPLAAEELRGDAPDAPPQSPQQEQAQFHLPPGFEIQLVAAEPEIQKPINLNFDAGGRLWVSGSEMYPWPAGRDAAGASIPKYSEVYAEIASAFSAAGKEPPPSLDARDTVRILFDFDAAGHPRRVQVFADGLNIPSGVQPLPRVPGSKGEAAIVYSIPYIWRLEDCDGDGYAEHREILYGPFGYLDTHGGCSSFMAWTDGWIYGTHGFRNSSEVKDRWGKKVMLDSGNTFRFRPDGSRFEVYAHGQTNPFGLAFDAWGNLYSADSHSKPVYLLLPGASYEGLGKSADELGFAPRITEDDHGSSAIAGIAYYEAEQFPPEFRGNLFNGNPVTRRINRDALEWHGSTPKAIRQPDFLTCDDPWFRPVQVKLGPDGALYVADFYNPVIGHYEVPLTHPRRDHTHGRIWRIVYTGGGQAEPGAPNLDRMGPEELAAQLAHPNLEVRRLAVGELAERIGPMAHRWLQRWSGLHADESSPLAEVARGLALSIEGRWGLDPGSSAEGDPFALALTPREVAAHPFCALAKLGIALERPEQAQAQAVCNLLASGEGDSSREVPAVQRLCCAYLSRWPTAVALEPLLVCQTTLPPEDTELRHALRMSLRDCLQAPGGFENATKLSAREAHPELAGALADAAAASSTAAAGDFLFTHLQRTLLQTPRANEYVRLVLWRSPGSVWADRALVIQQMAESRPFRERLGVAVALAAGVRRRGNLASDTARWMEKMIAQGLAAADVPTVSLALAGAQETPDEGLQKPLTALLEDEVRPTTVRQTALIAVAKLPAAAEVLGTGLTRLNEPALRRQAVELLGKLPPPAGEAALLRALATAPADLALTIAQALSLHAEGAAALVRAIEQGQASPSLLQSGLVQPNLERVAPELRPRIAALAIGLPREDERLNQVIAACAQAYRQKTARAEEQVSERNRGAAIFKQNCAPCHRLRGAGGTVGPNLDGVAARGVARLVEDILDPNRNVDPAFRQVFVELRDGRTVSGANPRESGEALVLQDATGASQEISNAQIQSRTVTRLSLMPPTFEQSLRPEELNALLAYLLNPDLPSP